MVIPIPIFMPAANFSAGLASMNVDKLNLILTGLMTLWLVMFLVATAKTLYRVKKYRLRYGGEEIMEDAVGTLLLLIGFVLLAAACLCAVYFIRAIST